MRRVVWAHAALAEFESALAYINADNPRAAALIAARIDEAARKLGEMPTGRPGRVEGTYEKVVGKTRYIMAYSLSDRRITILRIIHGNRHWPDENWPE